MTSYSSSNELMTVKEVAIYLKVTETTVYRMVADERIPFIKFGRVIRFNREQLNNWIDESSSQNLTREEGSQSET